MIRELIKKNRTYRRFCQEVKVENNVLEELIDLARLSSSGANLQSLKYVLSNEKDKNELIFQHLKWAGYLIDWNGPEEGEKPTGLTPAQKKLPEGMQKAILAKMNKKK